MACRAGSPRSLSHTTTLAKMSRCDCALLSATIRTAVVLNSCLESVLRSFAADCAHAAGGPADFHAGYERVPLGCVACSPSDLSFVRARCFLWLRRIHVPLCWPGCLQLAAFAHYAGDFSHARTIVKHAMAKADRFAPGSPPPLYILTRNCASHGAVGCSREAPCCCVTR